MRALQVFGVIFPILSGCSTYPLPQDAAGVDTKYIVANIRCQARRAVRRAVIERLEDLGDVQVTRRYRTSELIQALDDGRQDFSKLRINDFVDEKVRKAFAYYATTLATYEFTLRMTEENRQGGSIELIRNFVRRTDRIGIGLTEGRIRDNSRIFVLHDTFFNLATGIKHPYCEQKPGVDFIFPMRGRLPVEDLINNYIYINQWGSLDKTKDASFEGTPKGPATRQMADTIVFTTKLSTVNNPTIAYNPLGYGFATNGLTFTNENSRSDLHQVIITLTTTDLPDGRGGRKAATPLPPEALRRSGNEAINLVRNKNTQDDIGVIARSLSQGLLFGP